MHKCNVIKYLISIYRVNEIVKGKMIKNTNNGCLRISTITTRFEMLTILFSSHIDSVLLFIILPIRLVLFLRTRFIESSFLCVHIIMSA